MQTNINILCYHIPFLCLYLFLLSTGLMVHRLTNAPALPVGFKIKERWLVMAKIGQGGCGAVYEMHAIEDSTSRVALKIEPVRAHKRGVLKMEVTVLKALQGRPHVANLYGCGQQPKFCYMVMTLVGPNLSQLRANLSTRKFSASTTVRAGIQCLRAIRDLHEVGYVHRDVKPGNFAIGLESEDQRRIYVLDFGLARKYIDIEQGKRGQLREPRARAFFRGTVRYCSANVHLRLEQGRHDDLMSLLYMLIELVHGLPWTGAKRDLVFDMKQKVSDDRLLNGCPPEFKHILSHIKQLNYRSDPDYVLIHKELEGALRRMGGKEEDLYDWQEFDKTQRGEQEEDEKRVDETPSKDKDSNKSTSLIFQVSSYGSSSGDQKAN